MEIELKRLEIERKERDGEFELKRLQLEKESEMKRLEISSLRPRPRKFDVSGKIRLVPPFNERHVDRASTTNV